MNSGPIRNPLRKFALTKFRKTQVMIQQDRREVGMVTDAIAPNHRLARNPGVDQRLQRQAQSQKPPENPTRRPKRCHGFEPGSLRKEKLGAGLLLGRQIIGTHESDSWKGVVRPRRLPDSGIKMRRRFRQAAGPPNARSNRMLRSTRLGSPASLRFPKTSPTHPP